jgi:hypothetical protein
MQIVYSASVRCPCGHGLAHDAAAGDRAVWMCGLVLGGEAAQSGEHEPPHPIITWSVRDERHPAANGATTRPGA